MAAPPPIEVAPTQGWRADFWDCFSPADLCIITACLTCVTYGKTHHRLENGGSLEGYSPCNGPCCLWYCSSFFCLTWLPTMLQRGKLRARYGLQGGDAGDLAKACCCVCCDLMQQEKEMVFRQSLNTPGTAVTTPYEAQAVGMQYGQK